MKHGRNPTVKQCEILKGHKLNYLKWLIVKHTSKEMVIVHRNSKHQRTVSLEKEKATGKAAR